MPHVWRRMTSGKLRLFASYVSCPGGLRGGGVVIRHGVGRFYFVRSFLFSRCLVTLMLCWVGTRACCVCSIVPGCVGLVTPTNDPDHDPDRTPVFFLSTLFCFPSLCTRTGVGARPHERHLGSCFHGCVRALPRNKPGRQPRQRECREGVETEQTWSEVGWAVAGRIG